MEVRQKGKLRSVGHRTEPLRMTEPCLSLKEIGKTRFKARNQRKPVQILLKLKKKKSAFLGKLMS